MICLTHPNQCGFFKAKSDKLLETLLETITESFGPTVLRCSKTEDFIKGKALTEENVKKAHAQIESE